MFEHPDRDTLRELEELLKTGLTGSVLEYLEESRDEAIYEGESKRRIQKRIVKKTAAIEGITELEVATKRYLELLYHLVDGSGEVSGLDSLLTTVRKIRSRAPGPDILGVAEEQSRPFNDDGSLWLFVFELSFEPSQDWVEHFEDVVRESGYSGDVAISGPYLEFVCEPNRLDSLGSAMIQMVRAANDVIVENEQRARESEQRARESEREAKEAIKRFNRSRFEEILGPAELGAAGGRKEAGKPGTRAVSRKPVSSSFLASSTHAWNHRGICTRCGLSQEGAEHFGWSKCRGVR